MGGGANLNPNFLRNLGPENKFLGGVQIYKGGGQGNTDYVQTQADFLTKGLPLPTGPSRLVLT